MEISTLIPDEVKEPAWSKPKKSQITENAAQSNSDNNSEQKVQQPSQQQNQANSQNAPSPTPKPIADPQAPQQNSGNTENPKKKSFQKWKKRY